MIRINRQNTMRSMDEGTIIEVALDSEGTAVRAMFMDMRDPEAGTIGCKHCVWSDGDNRSVCRKRRGCLCTTTVPVALDSITGGL
jgi:hypothetical protein